MKKAQIAASIFIYTLSVVIIAGIFVLGYKYIYGANETISKSDSVLLKTKLVSDISSISTDYGSLRKVSYTFASELCLADLSKKDIILESELINFYPLMKDSITSETGKNAFLVSKSDFESFYVGEIKIDHYPFFKCFSPKSKTDFSIQGLGDKTIIQTEFVASAKLNPNKKTELESTDRVVELGIPAHSSSSVETVSVEMIDPNIETQNKASDVYQFGPSGAVFSKPIELKIKYNPSLVGECPSTLTFNHYHDDGSFKAAIPSKEIDCKNHIAVFEISSFSFGYLSGGGGAQNKGDYTISGVVFLDNNKNQIYDSGDKPLSNEVVYLQDWTGQISHAKASTDSNGKYSFSGKANEKYRITHYVPSGYERTTDDSRPLDPLTRNDEWNFGIFASSVSESSCTLQPGLACMDYKVTPEKISISIKNSLGKDIQSSIASVQYCGLGLSNELWKNGDSRTFAINCKPSLSGTNYSGLISISYSFKGTGPNVNNGHLKSKIESSIQCKDTDGGLNYYTAGTALGIYGSGTDFCLDIDNDGYTDDVQEYYCDGDRSASQGYVCPNGCKDGACVDEKPECVKDSECPPLNCVQAPCPTVKCVNGKCTTSLCGNGICDSNEEVCTAVCPLCPAANNTGACPPCSETCEYTCPNDCNPPISIISPNGGENWIIGSIQTIKWNIPDSLIKENVHYGMLLGLTDGPTQGLIWGTKFNKKFPIKNELLLKFSKVTNPNGEPINILPGNYKIQISLHDVGSNCPLCRNGVSDIKEGDKIAEISSDKSDFPFTMTSLSSITLTYAEPGAVKMYQDPIKNVWVVVAPDGKKIDTEGSTCDGLPEAIDFASKNGYSLHVIGGQISGDGKKTAHTVINCKKTLWLPPFQHTSINLESVTLNFPPEIGNSPGLVFNSAMLLDWKMTGQVVYFGTGRAVYFFPRSPVPYDKVASIIDSNIQFMAIAVVPETNKATGAVAVAFDVSSAPIQRVKFHFQEVNGGDVGIMVFSPEKPTGFIMNEIYANTHQQKNAGISIGHTPTNYIYGNRWDVNAQPNPSGNAAGLISYGQNDMIFINVQAGEAGGKSILDGIKLESTAAKNHIFIGRNDAKNKVNDQSASKDNMIYG